MPDPVLPPFLLILPFLVALSGGAMAEPDDLEDVPAETVQIGKDEQMRYVRIGPVAEAKPPTKAGYPLLVILPGGGGGEAFAPFCRRILKHACPKGWVGAQVIAPKWRDDQQVVWPTAKLETKGMRFTTEALVAKVIKDAKKWKKIDPDAITILGWSSSGPALWELSAQKKPPVKRYFIAMSVFKKSRMPSRPPTRGRSWYLLHSPEDKVCPLRLAEEGRDYLKKAKARQKFVTYTGGHGWHGNIYGNLRKGFDWLTR